ncbi:chitinase-like protein Idgf3 [Musca vetustissima]|uniref:chitinase-like protein Idgf3 n=1 Tax=Musca vetustissima TaxID=27455 RepID=UPI002AB78647|nr:chitinase-like protein Idgf3 [Musca vetustissima]
MKLIFILGALALTLNQLAAAKTHNVICYYDTSSVMRTGPANFTTQDLEISLQLCTHIVYGYAAMRASTFELVPGDKRQLPLFQQVNYLKKRFPHVKFLLSLGGNMDTKNRDKYMRLLESNRDQQRAFINSALGFVRNYQFDGLDLAYQFTEDKPVMKESLFNKVYSAAKDKVISNLEGGKSQKKLVSVAERRIQVTQLIGDLKQALRSSNLLLSLTVLPNVNASRYFNIPVIMGNLDFVTLATFDYSTPQRTPKQADYLAPLQPLPANKLRNPYNNVDSQVSYWLRQGAAADKLNIGVAAHGRTWQFKKLLKSDKMPITSSLDGPAAGDLKTRRNGLLSWPEVCNNIKTMIKFEDKTLGNYAHRAPQVKGSSGLLITYENVPSIGEKALYAKSHNLGGMALFDLSLDDVHGECSGEKFTLLKTIRNKLI